MYLYDLIGKRVRVNNEGPESRTGRLLGVGWDHIAIDTKEDGVVYYNLRHVKSIFESHGKDKDGPRDGRDLDREPQFIRAMNFMHLLRSMVNEKIQLNRGGPDKLVGKLVGFGPGFLVMEQKNERMRVPLFHIKNVSVVDQMTEQNQDQERKSYRNRGNNSSKRQKNRSRNRR